MIYRNGFLLKIYTSSYDVIRLLPVLVYPFLLSAIGNTSNLPWFQSGAGYSARLFISIVDELRWGEVIT